MQMDKEQYGKTKVCLVSCMQEGRSWQVANAQVGLQISQSNAYQLWRTFRLHSEAALFNGRHGHPSKLRGAARAFLEERCRQAPQTPSSTVQVELQERFDLHVSISQINRVRVALGISNRSKAASREKKLGWQAYLDGPTGCATNCTLLQAGGRSCLVETSHRRQAGQMLSACEGSLPRARLL